MRQAELATYAGMDTAAQQVAGASEVKAEGGWTAEAQPGSAIKPEAKQEVQPLLYLQPQDASEVKPSLFKGLKDRCIGSNGGCHVVCTFSGAAMIIVL